MTQPSRESLIAALDKALGIIELADNRAMAADGPVSHVRDEMSDAEWRSLYVALGEARALAAPPEPLREARLCGCNCRCHTHQATSEWPGPCDACCEPGMNCDCGRALGEPLREAALLVLQSQRVSMRKRPLALATALEALRAALLPDPVEPR